MCAHRVLDGNDQALEFDREVRRVLVEAMQVPLRARDAALAMTALVELRLELLEGGVQ